MNNRDLENKSSLESSSKELRKFKEIESTVDNYILEIKNSGDLTNVFQFTKEMANIIIFLAENDRKGTLFNFVTDYLEKMIDKGKIIRQEKGL
ncbi:MULTISPECIES: hypothetical protein [Methanobacterium]|uniref:Uncharacterized protein n=1 Tax=Methanobacterium veterum TaxID=408577 RepID=A0A9E4ZXG5_9EURY|nr:MULTISPECIES: hypothetical protein [Methanobacterium]MCZ3367357.1 hypothetical protein [Methanobacterium veterum]MCZ3373495.1 hypothetical protein [Methanobacterium veterum]